MSPLDGEKTLVAIDEHQLVLTTHRVRSNRPGSHWTGAPAEFISILLEEVSSCTITQKSRDWLGWLGLVFLFVGVAASEIESRFLGWGLGIAVVLFVIYYLTISNVIIISSPGASIQRKVGRFTTGSPRDFVEVLESAKNDRYLLAKWPQQALGSTADIKRTRSPQDG